MHPLADVKVPAGALAIHWFEQSSYALKDEHGTLVQIDPYFPRTRPADRFVHSESPLDEATLPTDYVLLTHDHLDHTFIESLTRIHQSFPGAKYVGPTESIKHILQDTAIQPESTTIIQTGMGVDLRSMEAYAVYAKPPQGDPAHDIRPPDVTHLGYILKASGHTLYFSGDPIHTFPDLDNLISAVAAYQPEIGFLTNHPSEGEFPFFAGCVKMATRIGLKYAVPAHRSCFVKRDYDPQAWAANFPPDGPQPLIIPHNSHVIYRG